MSVNVYFTVLSVNSYLLETFINNVNEIKRPEKKLKIIFYV